MAADSYGRFYHRVGLTDGTVVYLYADVGEVDAAGSLIFWGKERKYINLVIAPGHWQYTYVASDVDGWGKAIEHWNEPKATKVSRVKKLEEDMS